jgi:hypothetical protein
MQQELNVLLLIIFIISPQKSFSYFALSLVTIKYKTMTTLMTKPILLSACFLLAVIALHAQSDTAMDCYTQFFDQAKKIPAPASIQLTKNGKMMTLANFQKGMLDGEEMHEGLVDLDGDGIEELVIYHNTGGAHCCDEFYFYANTAPNKYRFAGQTYAGDVCVTSTKEFLFDFYQQFGYFFTCFACSYTDSTDAGLVPVRNIVLKYSKGKLLVQPGDQELRSQVNDNLSKLGEQPYEKLEDETAQDNGLRKEFAINLAVFYYSFGRNMIETKKLFDKYYKFPDAKKVWAEFVRDLQHLRAVNIF